MKKIGGAESPLYKHDCSACTFLGTYELHDLYHCGQVGIPTVIARWSSEGPAYTSGVEIAKALETRGRTNAPDVSPTTRALRVAYLIARDVGLRTE